MMLHPATVHFAIVLPLVASVFGAVYLFTRTESAAKWSARTTLIAALAMIGVWYTGNQAGPLVYKFLSSAGQHELLEHKQLGLYLAIAMGVIALMQIIGCKMKNFAIQALGIILLFGATATTFIQGKHGGEIVYDYGQPFQMQQLANYLENDDDLGMAEDTDEVLELIKTQITVIEKATPEKIQTKVQK